MPFTSYSELKTAVAAKLHRDDLESDIEDAIALAEAEMQVDCKLVDFETDATITITAGTGSLPTGFLGLRSVYWNGATRQPLSYITPDRFDSLRVQVGVIPSFYTISGTTLRVTGGIDGSVIATANVRFTPLSVAAPSNAILASHPDAYLYGTLKHMAVHVVDDNLLQKAGVLFNAAKDRITTNNKDRKYAGPLQVRAR